MTTAPTPLTDLDLVQASWLSGIADSDDEAAFDRLRAFLQSPAVQALADPKFRAAAEVVIGRLPELMEMEAKATPGEWDYFPLPNESNLWGSIKKPSPEETLISGSVYVADADFIVAARNALHDAAQAAKEASHD